jgi:hypothetical protein
MILITIIFLLILPFLIFFLHIIIIKWTYELKKEGCECSNLWHRIYIKYYAIIFLLLLIITLLFYFSGITFSIFPYIQTLRIISFTIFIIYLCTIIDYIIKLKN